MTELPEISFTNFSAMISSVAAIGTAAYGLVDTSKAFRGGISNLGFGFIHDALTPFSAALSLVNQSAPFELAKANWLNGMDKAEQKAAIKNLIRLGLTSTTAKELAENVTGITSDALGKVAAKIEKGEALDDTEIAVLARFDATVDARLDAAFERADQKYRNSARAAAAVVAIGLAEAGAWSLHDDFYKDGWLVGLAVGLIAVPIAPIAKDLTSAISTAVSAFKAIRR